MSDMLKSNKTIVKIFITKDKSHKKQIELNNELKVNREFSTILHFWNELMFHTEDSKDALDTALHHARPKKDTPAAKDGMAVVLCKHLSKMMHKNTLYMNNLSTGNFTAAVATILSQDTGKFDLKAVQTLLLCHNQISSISQAFLSKMEDLTHLDISHNKFTSFPVELLSSKSLRFVNFSSNTCDAAPLESPVSPKEKRDEIVDVMQAISDISAVPAACVQLNTSITHLKLNDCQLSEFPTPILSMMNLVKLEMSHNLLMSLPAGIGNCLFFTCQ